MRDLPHPHRRRPILRHPDRHLRQRAVRLADGQSGFVATTIAPRNNDRLPTTGMKAVTDSRLTKLIAGIMLLLRHTPRHSAYRSQFVVVAYPWHPLHGQRVRVYGRQGRAGRQILYIEVQPGLSRELPAWMCDGAACASITSGSAQIAVAGLIELRAILDSRSVGLTAGRSSTSSTAKEDRDETSLPQSTGARSRAPRPTAPAATGAGGAAQRAGRPAARSPRQSRKRDTDRAGGM